jgi:hypothetical protein
VIFETMQAKKLIYEHFQIAVYKRLFYQLCCCLWCCCKKKWKRYKLKKTIPTVYYAPEPGDLIFENIHVPMFKRVWREILVYSVGVILVASGIVTIILLRIAYGFEYNDPSIFKKYIFSGICAGISLIIFFVADILIGKIIRNQRSSLAYESMMLYIRLNFLNFNLFLCVLMNLATESHLEFFVDQLLFTMGILILTIPFVKVIKAVAAEVLRKRKFRRLMNRPDIVSRSTQKQIVDQISKPVFNFESNIDDLSCYVFITTGFYFIGILPLVLLGLLGVAISFIIDKWVIVKYTSPVRTKTQSQGLNFFRVLQWDIRIQLLSLASLAPFSTITGFPTGLTVILYSIFGIAMILPLGDSLQRKWLQKWAEGKENVRYQDVSHLFPNTYQGEYPLEVY